jgi:hypothetical protein
MVWKLIETAPKDGTNILLAEICEGEVRKIDLGCWEFIETSDWDGQPVWDWSSLDGIEFPTHWCEAPSLNWEFDRLKYLIEKFKAIRAQTSSDEEAFGILEGLLEIEAGRIKPLAEVKSEVKKPNALTHSYSDLGGYESYDDEDTSNKGDEHVG